MSTSNKTLIFSKVPEGLPVPGEHLTIQDRPIDLTTAPPNGLVLEIYSVSFDPYQRPRMRDASVKSYFPAFDIDGPITNTAVATVLKSDNKDYAEGDVVLAFVPTAQYARVEDVAASSVRKVVNPHNLDLNLFLGPLGMPGLTAWSGLHKIGQPQKGETLFVSSAAGAVGQVVGQIAKREGLTVIGSVGSDEKLEFITKELGFDAGFNYKKESVFDALPRLAPNGIDIYFENVGGDHLEAALDNINVNGRIPVCGMISSYSTPRDKQQGVKNLMTIVGRTVTMEGFLVGKKTFGPAYAQEHREKFGQWLAEGSVKSKLHVVKGIDNAAEGLVGMLEGKNFGKALLQVK